MRSIVFVHGFTGDPKRTWTHKRGDTNPEDGRELPQKARKLNPFSAPHDARQVYWPHDLLPSTVPNARILTYGYDSHIRHRFLGPMLNKTTVYHISGDFLVALEAARRQDPSRPLLFIVHSLGGIVVKEMLRRSSGYHSMKQHLHAIF
jgi:hypothetical protein